MASTTPMRWIDATLAWLFPTLLVEGTPWSQLWHERERESFVTGCLWCFPTIAIAYISHYYFYDAPNNLQPLEFWFRFRLFMAGTALAAFLYYLSPAARWQWYRIPAVVVSWLMVMSQAYIALWHGRESWIFCYILMLGAVLILRMSILKSLLFVGFAIATTTQILLDAGNSITLVFTGSVIALATPFFVRAGYLSEVRTFLLTQENIAAQKKIIELNIEFAERIRSFIPRVIASRIEQAMDDRRKSVIEASIEVMTPKTKEVACLFSDIRGFTQQSKDLEAFVRKSVIPEVRASTELIEDYGGIPRKVGDLVFAYFDHASVDRSLLCAILAGIKVSRLNSDMNATMTSKEIRRYVLVSHGEAVVGNLGGYDSSIEITALGSPVNYLSRLDEVTKAPAVKALLHPGDLVVSEATGNRLKSLVSGLSVKQICLDEMGVRVRDFPEEVRVFSIAPSDDNYSCALQAIDEYQRKTNGRRDPETVAA